MSVKMAMPRLTVYNMHVLDALKLIPDDSIDVIVTSPPYWGHRYYGEAAETIWGGDPNCEHEWIEQAVGLAHENRNNVIGTQEEAHHATRTAFIYKFDKKKSYLCQKCGAWRGQLGLEPDYLMYIDHMLQITAELKRVLKPQGTFWLNMGQTYAGNMGKRNGWTDNKLGFTKEEGIEYGVAQEHFRAEYRMPDKCLMQIPERLTIRMVDEQGWILRNDVIWFKEPNHMPSSAKDRLTNAYEHVYLFVKNKRYYFNLDAIREPLKHPENAVRRARQGHKTKQDFIHNRKGSYDDPLHTRPAHPLGKNPGDVWSIKIRPYKGNHFAAFTPELPERCIKAGCPENCVVLDPFAGSGTTLAVALDMGLNAIGIEINPDYVKLIEERTKAKERQNTGSLKYEVIK